MPVQTWTPGQILTSAEIGTVTNMLPYYVPLSLGSNSQAVSPVAGTLTGITCGAYTGCIVTLPTPTLGVVVGVAKIDATSPSLIIDAGSGGLILGPGFGAGERLAWLGAVGAYVILEADGTNWHVIGGAQDTGWLPIPSYSNSWVSNAGPATGGTVAGYRKIGNTVYLGGTIKTGTTATIAMTLPAYVSNTTTNCRPNRAAYAVSVTTAPYSLCSWAIATTGTFTPTLAGGTIPALDSIDFSVD